MGIFAIVPHQHIYIVQFLGRYSKQLKPGFNFLIPFIERVAYKQSLKERSHSIQHQTAVTKDNVSIQIDGVLYFRVNDAYKASYGAVDSVNYTYKLAQSITRSEIGKLALDETFSSRQSVNIKILESLQHATSDWGIQCLRYQVKDIQISQRVKKMMTLQAQSQRLKRAEILKSEAKKITLINQAIAEKNGSILEAEGLAQNKILTTKALVERIQILKNVINTSGYQAFNFNISEHYIQSLKGLKNKNIILESNLDDPKQLIEKSLNISKCNKPYEKP